MRESPTVEVVRQHGKGASSPAASGTRPAMMRVRDVATRWALDDDTIYGMIRRGELEAQRFGARCIRVPLAAVEAREQCQGRTEVRGSS